MVFIILQMLRMNVPEPQKSFENFSRLWELIMIVCTDLFREILSFHIRPSDERLEARQAQRKTEKGLKWSTEKSSVSNEERNTTFFH